MTINPQSSITDMAAHLNAKPTVGPDYLKIGSPILFSGGPLNALPVYAEQVLPIPGKSAAGLPRAIMHVQTGVGSFCPVIEGDSFVLNGVHYEVGRVGPAKATARQAAKSMNFGHQPEPVVDGCTTSWIFRTYEEIQREIVTPWKLDDKGNKVPRLTPKQLESARSMWAARLEHKVEASAKADAERERNQVTCQGLWADPDENL